MYEGYFRRQECYKGSECAVKKGELFHLILYASLLPLPSTAMSRELLLFTIIVIIIVVVLKIVVIVNIVPVLLQLDFFFKLL